MTHGTDEPDESPDAGTPDETYRSRQAAGHGAHSAPSEDDGAPFGWTDTSGQPQATGAASEAPIDASAQDHPSGEPVADYPSSEAPVWSYPAPEHAPAEPQPSYEQPAYKQPSYEQPAYQPPSHDQPAYQQPAYEQQPSYEQQQPYGQYPQDQYPQNQYQPDQPNHYQPDQGNQQQPGYAQPAQPHPGQPPYQQPQQAPPPRAPRPEDLLVQSQSSVTDQPASWGWRGKMNRASGGLFKPKAAPVEIAAREDISDIQHSFSRPMTVVVVQPKGGAGKTPTTICLSAAFGAHRGGYVVGWDDNETRGTLAVRVNNPDNQQATVWDLLSDLAAFERYDARVGDLSHYVRAQPDAHFDALVSDDNPGNMAQIGERAYQRLHTVLQRFYRMIVVDTGNNVRSSNWQAAVASADMIVVVSTYQRDVGYSGSWVLDHLAQTGREELARNAVTILSAADPTTDKTVRDQLVPHFTARTRAVCEIPYDKELAHGGPIRWAELAPATRNAWISAGATIVNCLAEDDRRALAARRA